MPHLTHNAANDQHGKRQYVIIWAVLLVLLIVSIALGHVPNPFWMNGLVFTIAGIKMVLVMRYFMHLRFEPWLITVLMIAAALTLVVLLLGVSPDVTYSPGPGPKPL